jgi:CDP-6-deoxy-D-xylo-4-hexulose-3-dehydrase
MSIKLVKSSFYREQETKRALAKFILEQDVFSMNLQCQEFEKAFSEKQGRKHAVYVTNGSAANLLLIQTMLNLGRFHRGDKIGFSALTWPTNVMPIMQLGLEPVPIDCDIATLNVSPANLAENISGLKGLFLTNVLGFCDDLPGVKTLCDEAGIVLLEDNCESLGSRVGGKLLGNFGVAATFSFFVGHHLSTIEGGMVVTDDDDLYQELVMGRAHGWGRNLSSDAQVRLRETAGVDEFYARYTFYDLASNYRPTEINGFIGNTQIGYWDEIVSRRADNFERLSGPIGSNGDFIPQKINHMDIVSNFAVPVVCRSAELAVGYKSKFDNAGVEIRPVIAGNMTRQPFYRKYFPKPVLLPNSDLVHQNGFYFGNNPELTENELALLTDLLDAPYG